MEAAVNYVLTLVPVSARAAVLKTTHLILTRVAVLQLTTAILTTVGVLTHARM